MGYLNLDLKFVFLGVEELKEMIFELIEGYNFFFLVEGKVYYICFKVDLLEDEIERLKKYVVIFLLGDEIEILLDGICYIFFVGFDGEWIEFFEMER